jgi:hypothetical protein
VFEKGKWVQGCARRVCRRSGDAAQVKGSPFTIVNQGNENVVIHFTDL